MASSSRSKLTVLAQPGANARLYVGTNCATVVSGFNTPLCPDLLAEQAGLSVFTKDAGWAVETTVSRLFPAQNLGCAETLFKTIWLWIDSAGAGHPDSSITGANAPNLVIGLDGTPPPAPDTIVVEGADQSLRASWSDVSANTPDLAGYLVFCMRGDLQVFNPSFYNYQYMTGLTTCDFGAPMASGPDPMGSIAGNTTAVEIDAPREFQNLDPNFLCSGRLTPAETSFRLRTLQDGIPYTVGIAAVDLNGNVSPIRKAFVQSPIAGVDPLPDPDAGATGAGATDAGATKLGSSGCECHVAQTDGGQIPWLALLGLALTVRLRRRGRSDG
jgi:MYXO-CTERM domain-containing protein